MPDHAAAHALWRRTRDDLFAAHPASPLLPADRSSFAGLNVTPYAADWRFEVTVTPATSIRIELPTGTDGLVPLELLGVAQVPTVGPLGVWRLASYGGGLFVPVKDATAGRAGGTYGGGRYLIDTVKGVDLGSNDGSLVLDFNFAYNPSCAYDPSWACPLAQRHNVVSVDIPVGERTPIPASTR